jgi:hypothetical protein
MEPTIEIAARLLFAVAVFAIMAAWEVPAPDHRTAGVSRRQKTSPRPDADAAVPVG